MLMSLLSTIRRHSTLPNRSGLTSFVNLGRAYEEKCQKVISKNFETKVNLVGGACDGGIDLTWSRELKTGHFINFIGQCKSLTANKGVKTETCRGLEGSLSACPPGTIGCIISNKAPTSDCLDRIKNSFYPIMYLNINEEMLCTNIYGIYLNNQIKSLFPSLSAHPIRTTSRPFPVTVKWD